MPRLLLIANPSASSFTGALHRDVMEILMQEFEVTRLWPDGPAEARAEASRAAANGFDVVAGMGGDGVIHHAANGIAGTATALAVIPAGTTNVLARVLGIPRNPRKAAAGLASWSPRPVATAEAAIETGMTRHVEHATFAIGAGFDAAVVADAERRPLRKNFFGGIHYARTAATTLITDYWFRRPHLRIECDGERVDGVAVLVQVHWPFTYFGRMPLRVTPRPVSGPAAAIFERLPRLRSPEVALRAVTGRDLGAIRGIRVRPGFQQLVIEADPPVLLESDGELLGSPDRVVIRPKRNALLVLAPARETTG
jgi:diacylglycerol kinase family enzyme